MTVLFIQENIFDKKNVYTELNNPLSKKLWLCYFRKKRLVFFIPLNILKDFASIKYIRGYILILR